MPIGKMLAATLLLAVAGVASVGCSSDPSPLYLGDEYETEDSITAPEGDVGNDPIQGAEEAPGGMVPDAPSGTRLLVMTDVNLRSEPSTSGAILRVVPKSATVELGDEPERSGWLHVEHDGVRGWMSAQFLTLLPPDLPGDVDGPASPQNSILRASKSVGFSYWWGGGAWLASGVTESTAGSCSGGCPNCTHTGRYGADCSGMVAKAWQLGSKDLAVNDHPYGTIHFIEPRPGLWTRVARESLKPGDALVQNNGRTGHIVLYEKGDAWNTPTVYECKGCQSGCVYNARAFGAAYVGLRREGF